MKNNPLFQVNMVSRALLGFLFIYHGLVPKILWLSTDEIHLVDISGIGISATFISPLAGILEILLGCAIIFLRKLDIVIYAAAGALLGLLAYVVVMSPSYLVDAFNPVTTNILGMGLCYLILLTQKHEHI
ncbi:MAG: DoxX-like family protein [Oleispira sp.]|nr:DoxX-like family protein [Oleispira sp.]MBL4879898.1 DoxX-like family protein [Oleispira sp.]